MENQIHYNETILKSLPLHINSIVVIKQTFFVFIFCFQFRKIKKDPFSIKKSEQ